MRIPFLVVMSLTAAFSVLALAQEPLRVPSAPAPGSPGTATPQPHGAPPAAVPIRPRSSAPLLPPPPGGQALPGAQPRSTPDQPVPQLQRQLQRNSEGLGGQETGR